MSDLIPVFLKPVELPEYCFLSEAIEWIALGRVPEAQWIADNKTDKCVEYRFYWREMPDNFEPTFFAPWFEENEFVDLGIPQPEGYAEAAERCFNEGFDYLRDTIKLQEAMQLKAQAESHDAETLKEYAENISKKRKIFEELKPLDAMVRNAEAQFDSFYELAWAKMFQLILQNDIQVQGINFENWERFADEDQHEKAAEFVEIDPKDFRIGLDWRQNEIIAEGIKYVALRVSTKQILENRASLLSKGKKFSVERMGAFFQIHNGSPSQPRKQRGRSFIVDWLQVSDFLDKLQKEGRVPNNKESCIYEIIAFIETEFHRQASRTSVQRNLGKKMDAIFAQK